MLILLPVDASEASLDAVRHVLALQQAGLAVEVVLANAQDAPHLYEVVLSRDPAVLDQASEAAGHHALTAARHLLAEAGLPFTEVVGHGEPARVLLDLADAHGCQAIVIGAGQPGLLNAGRLGSVAQAVVHGARVPVTVVHHADPDEVDSEDRED